MENVLCVEFPLNDLCQPSPTPTMLWCLITDFIISLCLCCVHASLARKTNSQPYSWRQIQRLCGKLTFAILTLSHLWTNGPICIYMLIYKKDKKKLLNVYKHGYVKPAYAAAELTNSQSCEQVSSTPECVSAVSEWIRKQQQSLCLCLPRHVKIQWKSPEQQAFFTDLFSFQMSTAITHWCIARAHTPSWLFSLSVYLFRLSVKPKTHTWAVTQHSDTVYMYVCVL